MTANVPRANSGIVEHPRRRTRRLFVVVFGSLALAAGLCLCAPASLIGVRSAVQNFRVEGSAMAPAVHPGDYLLVDLLSYRIGSPARGDIVVFEAWTADMFFTKRVVGLPGEQILFRDGGLFIDGVELDEPYLDQPTLDHIGPVTLGDDEYYLLGDNRGNSSDSRAYGPLPGNLIIGRAAAIYHPAERRGAVPHHDFGDR